MAIYTQFGSEVKIISGNVHSGDVNIKFDDGEILQSQIINLKSDGGIQEVLDEIEAANERN